MEVPCVTPDEVKGLAQDLNIDTTKLAFTINMIRELREGERLYQALKLREAQRMCAVAHSTLPPSPPKE
jgi:hypothetical protein